MPKPAPTQQILLVDDDPGAIQLMGGLLANLASLRFATNGRDALRLALEAVPDLILLDAEMPGMSGFELLQAMKADLQLAAVPVIFITSHTEAGFEVSALEMGAVDFIAKPFRSSLVLARVRLHLRMKRMADDLRRAATMDALTGVANRKVFDEWLAREWLQSRRSGESISLLSIDVDHFKAYNERYGRQQGDECLRQVGAALVSACRRPTDLLARYDGAEFMMLLPRTARLGAEHIGRRVLDAVQALDICHQDSPPTRYLSVSVGIAFQDDQSLRRAAEPTGERDESDGKPCGQPNGEPYGEPYTAEQLVAAARHALQTAKRAGRARARMRDIGEPEPRPTPAMPATPAAAEFSELPAAMP